MKKFLLSVALTMSIVGCAGVAPLTFQDQVNIAQSGNTALVQTIGQAADKKLISSADAVNLLRQVRTAQDGIDLAQSVGYGGGGQDKLALATTVLNGVRTYLISRGALTK